MSVLESYCGCFNLILMMDLVFAVAKIRRVERICLDSCKQFNQSARGKHDCSKREKMGIMPSGLLGRRYKSIHQVQGATAGIAVVETIST
jgi:hypothetical protein